MHIIINKVVQTCHRCGGFNLSVYNINDDDRHIDIWCKTCDEQTLEGVVILDNIDMIEIMNKA